MLPYPPQAVLPQAGALAVGVGILHGGSARRHRRRVLPTQRFHDGRQPLLHLGPQYLLTFNYTRLTDRSILRLFCEISLI